MTRRDLFRSIASLLAAYGAGRQAAGGPPPPMEPGMYPLHVSELQVSHWIDPIDVTGPFDTTRRFISPITGTISASMDLAPGKAGGGSHDMAVWCSRDLDPRESLMGLMYSGEFETFQIALPNGGPFLRFCGRIQTVEERRNRDTGLYTLSIEVEGETSL